MHGKNDLAKQKETFNELGKLNEERFKWFIQTGIIPASEDAFRPSLDDLDNKDGSESIQNLSL